MALHADASPDETSSLGSDDILQPHDAHAPREIHPEQPDAPSAAKVNVTVSMSSASGSHGNVFQANPVQERSRVELCGMRGGVDTSEPFLCCERCVMPDICYGLEGCGRELDREAGFAPEDYAFTAKLLRQHNADGRADLFRAVCSNNLKIILAALDAMGDEP